MIVFFYLSIGPSEWFFGFYLSYGYSSDVVAYSERIKFSSLFEKTLVSGRFSFFSDEGVFLASTYLKVHLIRGNNLFPVFMFFLYFGLVL